MGARAGTRRKDRVPYAGGNAAPQPQTIPVQEQPGIAAIPLADLGFLARHAVELPIPIVHAEGEAVLQVRVPGLGAYAVNKAYTFSRRGGGGPADAPKGGKDLLCLHDLMAAGPEVVAHIEREIRAIARAGQDGGQVDTAASHLSLAVNAGDANGNVHAAALMLVERGGASTISDALNRVRGYMTDLHDILSEADPG